MQFTSPHSLIGDTNLAVHFHPDHMADLRASGLNDSTIRQSGVYSLSPRDISHFFNLRRGVPPEIETALCFPYQGGEFARIKLFPPIGKRKYSQPPGSAAHLYIPTKVAPGPLYIVEGEKKTLAAIQPGLNAIGIGGVWNWINHGEPIADLNLIDWQDREVSIIGDSDIWLRPDLIRALYALGQEVQSLGATVFFLEIPHQEDMKMGLDDFLVAGGNISDLIEHSIQSKTLARHKPWFEHWKTTKILQSVA